MNVPAHNHLADFIRLSLWLLGIVFVIYIILGLAAEKIVERLPQRYEAALASGFTSGMDDTAFPDTRKYLQKVLDSLVASSGTAIPKFAYRVSIHKNAGVNAVALPAGNIVVYSGLLAELKSENELAMVLAHELGHYAHRDHLRGFGRGIVLLSILSALGMNGDLPGFLAPSLQTLSLKYSRDQESVADRFAIGLLARTYGHAGGALEVFKVLKDQEKRMSTPGFFSTHPDTVLRMQALDSYLKQEKYSHGTVRPLPGTLPFKDDKKGAWNYLGCPASQG